MVGHWPAVRQAAMLMLLLLLLLLLLMVLLLMLPDNNLVTADTTTPTSLHCMACLLEAWPVQGVLPRSETNIGEFNAGQVGNVRANHLLGRNPVKDKLHQNHFGFQKAF